MWLKDFCLNKCYLLFLSVIHHMLLVAYMFILSVVARKCYRQDFEIPQQAQDEKSDAAQEPCPVLAVI